VISERQQWINLGIFAAVVAGAFTLVLREKDRPLWKSAVVGTAASLVLFALADLSLPYFDLFLATHEVLLGSTEIRVILALVVVLLGVSAHVFKRKNKLRYGQLEVLVGVISAFGIATGVAAGQSLFSRGIALVGAAYVVARGLNNWSEELEQNGNKYGHRSITQNIRAWIWTDDLDEGKGNRRHQDG
jgi:hypothetical protein